MVVFLKRTLSENRLFILAFSKRPKASLVFQYREGYCFPKKGTLLLSQSNECFVSTPRWKLLILRKKRNLRKLIFFICDVVASSLFEKKIA